MVTAVVGIQGTCTQKLWQFCAFRQNVAALSSQLASSLHCKYFINRGTVIATNVSHLLLTQAYAFLDLPVMKCYGEGSRHTELRNLICCLTWLQA